MDNSFRYIADIVNIKEELKCQNEMKTGQNPIKGSGECDLKGKKDWKHLKGRSTFSNISLRWLISTVPCIYCTCFFF